MGSNPSLLEARDDQALVLESFPDKVIYAKLLKIGHDLTLAGKVYRTLK
jgi:hypothetical protein